MLNKSRVRLSSIALVTGAMLIILLSVGCAKFPSNGVPQTGKRLIVTMTVNGQINPNYHYYIAFYTLALDPAAQLSQGPVPVVSGPGWGNGWGTSATPSSQGMQTYVVYDANQPQGYGVYQIAKDTNLLGKTYVGPPISYVTPPAGSNKLQFTLDLSQLAIPTFLTTTDEVNSLIDQINVNFITTNIVPSSTAFDGSGRFYDGLGLTGNTFEPIYIKSTQSNSNTKTHVEDAGDVPLPDLDIIDWSIEIQ
jgi:hypothetical protein